MFRPNPLARGLAFLLAKNLGEVAQGCEAGRFGDGGYGVFRVLLKHALGTFKTKPRDPFAERDAVGIPAAGGEDREF